MDATKIDVSHADDIMSARATYALLGSLIAGMMLWCGAIALVV